ncbi:MAG TPA: AraC family transcriptional regulator [Vicinamibacteria bacterium]|nr:AraC family transcriptional regulator [Vicinamibacteria bacterium]
MGSKAARGSSGHATVVAWGVQLLMRYLERRGVDAAELRHRAGFGSVDLDHPERRLPEGPCREVWRLAAEATGDEAIGIHVAEARTPGAFDVLEYAFRASPTLGDALGQVVRYARVMHDRMTLRLAPEGAGVRLTGRVPEDHPANRYRTEFFLATWLRLARDTCDAGIAPLDASFAHPAPARPDEHRRFFACPVLFEQPVVGLRIARADLGRPMHGADPALAALLGRQLDKVLVSLPADPSVSSRARLLVKDDLPSGRVSVERVAGQLAMSVRTLSRRLADERSSFRHLVESVRRELALAHLRDERMELAEIAFLLGYSESSAFHRSFKRWTGRTPLEFRRRAHG